MITKKYPDIRTIIEHLQMMSISGTLKILRSGDVEIKNEIVKYVYDSIMTKDIRSIREFLISNEDKFSADYVKLAQELFDAFDGNGEVMVLIADALWRMCFQLDKEIQFIGMLLNIKETLKKC